MILMEIIPISSSMNCGLKKSDFEGMGWGCEVEVEVQDFTLQKKKGVYTINNQKTL